MSETPTDDMSPDDGITPEQVEDIDPIEDDLEAAAPAEPEQPEKKKRSGSFMGVPIEVTISVGKARPMVSELVGLRRDSVLTLDSNIEDPVELYIGDRLIARGELQEIGDATGKLGVRLTEVADFTNDM